MPKWRRDSTFGPGHRVPLDREQRAVFKAKLKLARRPGRLTIACIEIARVMLDMMGTDGQLDPSVATIATRAAIDPSTVTRALARLRDLGFITWTRRLARDAVTGWRVEQISNAYCLIVPSTDMQFARAANFISSKTERKRPTGAAPAARATRETAFESAARQLRALGMPVPPHWGLSPSAACA